MTESEATGGRKAPPEVGGAVLRPGKGIAARTVIDRYHLTRLHSSGGLGRVWLATDPNIGREVALKELLVNQAARPGSRARFLREARITGQLEHPNIVTVYEVGAVDEGERPYYAMRFVRGMTLQEAIRKELDRGGGVRRWPRSRRTLLRALIAVGNAIAHAHSRGVVHRDLKPENIVLGRFGEQILLDWGLAKRLDGEPGPGEEAGDRELSLTETNAGSVLGTIAYMAPEQAAGRPADERTDIYGLGAILFEILTGRPPHVGDRVLAVLRGIVEGETPCAREIDRRAPRGLSAICAKAMAKRPEDRYATAHEVVEELERWLSDEAVNALPDSRLRACARWVRRHQGVAFAITVGLLVVGLLATLSAISLGAAAERERGLRERSMRATAELAALSVGREIDLRWYVLQSSAMDPELRAALQEPLGDGQLLQDWIDRQYAKHDGRAGARSWIVMDVEGIQRARHPAWEDTRGKSFAYRDYFHGEGRDFLPGTQGLAPISDVHRSVVFRSTVTHNLMVAFSVPVWSSDDEEPEVVGVLGMTVELGGFGFEELRLDEGQRVVLVDVADQQGNAGLVLQHPELARRRLEGQGAEVDEGVRVPPERVEQLNALCRAKFERLHRPEGSAPAASAAPISLLDPDYRDPVERESSERWLAAFEPVVVKGREGRASNTGWVVIVQERNLQD